MYTLISNVFSAQLEVETTGQIVSYVASQGPMQHTCKDFWQVCLRICTLVRVSSTLLALV